MNPLAIRCFIVSALALSASLLTACEGESTSFREAVEIQTLGITAIQVTPPDTAQDDIFINSGQSIQLAVTGTTSLGNTVDLDAGNRTWRTSDPSVFTVTDSGLLTGVGIVQGEAEVSVLIGGIESSALTITVSDASLLSIQSVVGATTLERCLPQEYYTVGVFDDTSVRTLTDVTYGVETDSGATLAAVDSATTSVNATQAGPLTLTAEAGSAAPFPFMVTVLDTLAFIDISPTLAAASVDVDRARDFTATGNYSATGAVGAEGLPPAPGSTRTEIITANVDWEIISNPTIASVVNDGENRGQVTGLSEGTATLQASCGTVVQTVNVTVNDVVTDSDEELSFADIVGDSISIQQNEQLQLRVSTGSEFQETQELTSVLDGVVFSVPSSQLGFVNEGLLETGLIRPLVGGVTINVTATYEDPDGTVLSASVTIEVL